MLSEATREVLAISYYLKQTLKQQEDSILCGLTDVKPHSLARSAKAQAERLMEWTLKLERERNPKAFQRPDTSASQ